jgi:rhodanese-related sulfurtransferase
MTAQPSAGYAGDVSAAEAYSLLERDKSAVLVDVRTKAEWTYVGVPDLSTIGKQTVLLQWQEFPSMAVNRDFAARLDEILRQGGAEPNTPILFLCRSGSRSRAAAIAMSLSGRRRCFNIGNGFEGPLDDKRRRGVLDGWKAQGLPWTQS